MPNVQLDDTDLFRRSNRHPTPTEEAMIKQLLAKEEESLARLSNSIEEYKKDIDLAQRNVSLFKERMIQAKTRQTLAVQLRDDLRSGLESIQRVDPLEETDAVAIQTDSEADQDTARHNQDLQAIVRSRKSVVQGITKQIEVAETSIKRHTEAWAIVREEFQGSLSMEQISIQTLDSTIRQREQLLISIRSKKNVLRSIWRLPHEIWNQIFRETAYQPLSGTEDIDWFDVPKTWRQSFILSAVCYQWRSVCRADPRLWKDPVVLIHDDEYPSEFDFETHYTLTSGILDTLTIAAQCVHTSLSDHAFREQLSHIKTLNVLIADIWGSGGNIVPTSDWWHVLPPIKEIFIFDLHTSQASPSTSTLPSSSNTSIRRVTCKNTALAFHNPMPVLEELSIDMQDGFPGLITTIHRSGTNLRKLHFVGEFDPDESHVAEVRTTLGSLKEVSMSCFNLMECFIPNFLCPSLQKISFPTPEMPEEEPDWDPFFAQGSLATTIKDVDICSMGCDDVQLILPFLDKLQNLNTLTLQGESVQHVLHAKISIMKDAPDDEGYSLLCFRTLETLKVKYYTGTGEVVLQYVEALQGPQRNHANQDSVQSCLKAVIFEGCPHITYDVKSRIDVLYPDD